MALMYTFHAQFDTYFEFYRPIGPQQGLPAVVILGIGGLISALIGQVW